MKKIIFLLLIVVGCSNNSDPKKSTPSEGPKELGGRNGDNLELVVCDFKELKTCVTDDNAKLRLRAISQALGHRVPMDVILTPSITKKYNLPNDTIECLKENYCKEE